MDIPHQSNESGLLAEIDQLRLQFPRTHELYREVCILLFFRHGITPTANKLYQLVRKGSMSAPTEALSHFWVTLRERSRVTVEHADLPDALKATAGEMVGALWKTAQEASRDSLAAFRAEATAAVDAAKAAEVSATGRHVETIEVLDRAREQLGKSDALAGQLREELVAAAATNAALERRLADARADLAAEQRRLDEERRKHAVQIESAAERSRLAEVRFAEMERRALVDIDRERTAAVKLQKILDAHRASSASATATIRAEYNAAQANLGHLREQLGGLQSTVATLSDERDRALEQLQGTRSQLESSIRQAAAEGGRAEHLREELHRLRLADDTQFGKEPSKASPDAETKKPRRKGASSVTRKR